MPDLSAFLPRQRAPVITLERLLTEPEWFGLTTASPVQRAICRALDGLPLAELSEDADVIASFGGASLDGRVNPETGRGIDNPDGRRAILQLPTERPDQMALCSGIRGGKSLLAATAAVRASQTCDVSRLGPGEIPRIPIVATSMDVARPTWEVLVARVQASPNASKLLLAEPTTERVLLRHPSGRPIEIRVIAGARAAATLVARWLAFAIFDESTRMVGQADGVVNLDEMLKAIALRMLPGAQILLPGSPWAPFGPVYNIVQEHFGKPSKRCVVVRSSGPMMNPFIWDDEKVTAAKDKPDEWRVDGLGQFMNAESGMFSETEVLACARELPLAIPPEDGLYYSAAIDPATRGNAFTLVIIGRRRTGQLFVAYNKQWIGSALAPLSPKVVFADMAPTVLSYRCQTLFTDEWAADALNDSANAAGLWLASEPSNWKLERYTRLRSEMSTEPRLELPPDLEFQRDVKSVRKVTTQSGVVIALPPTSDGRHCDYAPPLAMLMGHIPRDPDPVTIPVGTPERAASDAADAKEAARREVEQRNAKRSRRILGRFS